MASGSLVGVTGASGFIGSWVVKLLLERGFSVRAFVRDSSALEKLEGLPVGNPSLQFGEIRDLSSPPDDLAERLSGCHYLIHCASPVILGDDVTDPEEQVIKPAVNGTKKVLQAALQAKVKRVALTASLASVCGSQRSKDPAHVWTEADWNDEMGSPYSRSKTLAERAAWDFVAENPELELVVINPAVVIGPLPGTRISSTLSFCLDLAKGTYKEGVPARTFGAVDVRDVALVHILALENKEAKGNRFLLVSKDQYSLLRFADALREAIPRVAPERAQELLDRLPTGYAAGVEAPTLNMNSADNSKVESHFGLKLRSPAEAVEAQLQSMLSLGLI